jgi:hypothetical protein
MEAEKPLPGYVVKLDNYSSRPVFHILDPSGKVYETVINKCLLTPSSEVHEFFAREATPPSVSDEVEVLVPREDLVSIMTRLKAGEDIGFENTIGTDLAVYLLSCLLWRGRFQVPGKLFPVAIDLDSEFAPLLKLSPAKCAVKIIAPFEDPSHISWCVRGGDGFDLTGREPFLRLIDTQPWPVHTVSGKRCRSRSIPYQLVNQRVRTQEALVEGRGQALTPVPVLSNEDLPLLSLERGITASEALSDKSLRDALRQALKITYERVGEEEWKALSTRERRALRKSQSVPKWAIHAVKVNPANLDKIKQRGRGFAPRAPPMEAVTKPFSPVRVPPCVARRNEEGRRRSPGRAAMAVRPGRVTSAGLFKAVRRVLRELSRSLRHSGADVSRRRQAVSTAWGRLTVLWPG